MAWVTSFFHGGRDPVDVEREHVRVEAERDLAKSRGVEELDLADLEALDAHSRWYDYRGVRLHRVEAQIDPRDGTREMPDRFVVDAHHRIHFFNRLPPHRQPKR